MTKKALESINHEMWLAMDAAETWNKRANETEIQDNKRSFALYSSQAINKATGIMLVMKALGYKWEPAGIGQFGDFIKA